MADESRAWLEKAISIAPDDTALLYNVACVLSKQGEVDAALDRLEESIQKGWGDKDWILNDPDLEPVRTHPRYRALMDAMS